MKKKKNSNTQLNIDSQLDLYGYEKYFNIFNKLYLKKKLPNTILLSGQKGIGKSIFANHFTNYLLSLNENNKYDLKNFKINTNTQVYKLSKNNIHPNLFRVDSNLKDIGVNEIRNLISFLSKSSNLNNLKIIIIDNIENLNKNSSNALLKVLEEPKINTYFFLIYDNNKKILNTIKSRCSEFRINFTKDEKVKIFTNLIKEHNIDDIDNEIFNLLNFDTPGNLINYIISLGDSYPNISSFETDYIISCIEKYENEKDTNLFNTILFLIQNFYYRICLNNINNLSNYLNNYKKIIDQIHYLKKFNLNEKSILKSISNDIYNEQR